MKDGMILLSVRLFCIQCSIWWLFSYVNLVFCIYFFYCL